MHRSIGTLAALVVLTCCTLASCAGPPPDAYVGGTPASSAAGMPLGSNSSGEPCTQQAQGGGAAIFCGTWQQPSGEVTRGGPAGADALVGLATDSPWRSALDGRYLCGAPAASTILGDVPSVVMSCTRRVGGWPQVALVASAGGSAYFADSILPALPVLERAIGVLSGKVSAAAAPAVAPGQADALFAARLAAQSFRAGDIGQFETLMTAGTRANLAESYVAAEQAYRAAVALQQKVLGANNPNTAIPLMHLALQLSNEGRFAEADAVFAHAAQLTPQSAAPLAPARLLHYRALHAINQGDNAQAATLLKAAEAGYAGLLPPGELAGNAAPFRFAALATARSQADTSTAGDMFLEPSQQAALVGVIEARRYRAIAARNLGDAAEAEALIRSADGLAAAHGLRQRNLTARLYRTAATIADLRGDGGLSGMARASTDFGLSQPGSRPLAATELLRASELAAQGRGADGLPMCRRAVGLLRELLAGIPPALMSPCLGIYAAAAEHDPAGRQALLAEMFQAAQMMQGGITSQQIALAAARLAENAKDPKVGAAIRQQQDAAATLAELERQLDAQSSPERRTEPARGERKTEADLTRSIAEARSGLTDADAALQAAAPNYGQLVQEVVPASEVLSALAPDEAFVSIALTESNSWVFALRGGAIDVAQAPAGRAGVAALVKRVRASVEPTAAGLPPFDTEASATLYADTLGRVQSRLDGARSLVIAPTGPLLSLPFGVLLTGSASPDALATAPWLIRRAAISHVPSPASFVALRRIAGGSRAAQPWFGMGDFRPVTLQQAERTFPRGACEDSAKLFAGLPPLPSTRHELDTTRSLLGGSAGAELVGAGYTADHVRRADLKDYRVLHFAAHALLPTELRCQTEPAIVTSAPAEAPDASGALLTSAAVMGLDLDADVVILSACNSGGSGDSGGGESLSGLARAFFYAGARSLMVTHWSLNDQVGAILVADTMRRLQAADPAGLAGALQGAELALLDGAGSKFPPQIAHPFYWAPFALIGEGRGRTAAVASVGAAYRVAAL